MNKIVLFFLCSFVSQILFAQEEFKIFSTAFSEGQMIPAEYTCDGGNVSPPLKWQNPPAGTKSFALIVDDPDAPTGLWVHWVLFNIPGVVVELGQGIGKKPELPNGSIQGLTDFGSVGYGGPCPPSGKHRYFFKIYALDTLITLKSKSTKKQLEAMIKNHIIKEAKFFGTYQRN